MKRKKIGALLCVCLLLCGIGIGVEASPYDFETIEAHTFVDKVNAQELVINGNFDVPESTTKPLGWGIHPGQFGVGNAGEYVWGDETYVKIQGIGTRLLHQPIKVENGSGKKCQMSARVKVPSEDVDIRLRAAFIVLQDGEEIELETVINVYFNDITPNVWTQKVIEFVLPENISKIDFSMRSFSVLAVSVDDISLLMEGVVEDEEMAEKPPVLSADWEMIVNGGFDEVNIAAKTVTGWQAEPGANGTFDGRGANIQNDGDTQGNYIKVVSGATLPQIRQRISLLPGAEYRIIFKYKNPGMVSANFSCQMQYKRGGIGIELDGTKNMVAYYSSEWQDGFFDFTCPNEADGCNVSFRNHSVEGDICIDDVSLYMTKRPTRTLVETDERFYYTEWENGYVTVEDRQTEGSLGNGKAVLTILDGQTPTIDMIESTLSEGRTTISFPTVSALPEKGKDYVAKVDIYAEGEEFIETQSFPIARFDRPTYLGADGVFRKPDRNGVVQERNISLGDSVPFTLLDKTGDEISDIGITVIQMGNDPLNRSILERMNAAEEAGLYVIVSLYYNKKSAGHPDMLDSTIKTVNLVKDHPALFGYKVQDEPIQKMNTDEELGRAYTTIRNIDPHHPIYLDDSGEGSYKRLGRFCDIMDIDYYPGKGVNRASVISKKIAAGIEAVKGRKPVSLLQQAFINGGTFPTADEFRHYAYQTMFAGGSCVGYHSFGGEPGYMEPTSEEWAGLRAFAAWELDFMFDCFVNRKYPMLHEGEGGDVRWRTYVKDNKIYAFIINQAAQNSAGAGANTATVLLTDTDGGKAATGYTAKRVAGGEEETLTVNGTTLTVELAPQAAYIYEITPNSTLDFSDLKIAKYRDLLGYSWAYSAIVNMENAGVVNDITPIRFEPGAKITRGDFAYFLINALGCTSEATENFDDVPADAHYAKAVATGKALGILDEIGGNRFRPESEISRQDLMAIVARGIRICRDLEEGKEDLHSYTEEELIADCVTLDIAAMVRANIIRGNAENTIDPLGNTVRAEAAVIARRLHEWRENPWKAEESDVASDVKHLTSEERVVYYNLLMQENGTYNGNVWETSLEKNGTTYTLIVNGGQTTYTAATTSAGTYARELVTEGGSRVSGGTDGFTVTVPAGGSLLFTKSDTLLPGLYEGNVLKNSFTEEIVFRAENEAAFGALYSKYGNSWELLHLYSVGESVTVGEETYKFIGFSWSAAMQPQRAAITVEGSMQAAQ